MGSCFSKKYKEIDYHNYKPTIMTNINTKGLQNTNITNINIKEKKNHRITLIENINEEFSISYKKEPSQKLDNLIEYFENYNISDQNIKSSIRQKTYENSY